MEKVILEEIRKLVEERNELRRQLNEARELLRRRNDDEASRMSETHQS
jgi:prephenate dehydrogenase